MKGDKTLAARVAIRKHGRIASNINSSNKTYRSLGRTNATALLFYSNVITISIRCTWLHDFARVLYEALSDKDIDLGLG